MVIRDEQMTAFEEAAVHRFEEDVARRLHSAAPKHAEFLGSNGLREAVSFGIQKARNYNIISERGVCVYIDLMFMLCREFDTDLQFDRAAAVLAGDGLESERVTRLHAQGVEYVEQVTGPNNEHVLAALDRISGAARPAVTPSGDLATRQIAWFREIFPQKCDYLGSQRLQMLVHRGRELAARYGISSESGLTLYAGLMFLLGTAFDRDPLHPWAVAVLNDASIPGERERLRRLYAAGMDALERWARPAAPNKVG